MLTEEGWGGWEVAPGHGVEFIQTGGGKDRSLTSELTGFKSWPVALSKLLTSEFQLPFNSEHVHRKCHLWLEVSLPHITILPRTLTPGGQESTGQVGAGASCGVARFPSRSL